MTPAPLTDDQRYRALKARDRRFDGVFVVGVRTTGIYCRPSCPTPIQPLRRNVDFFTSTAAAQRAGLRACKRCRPDATPGSPEWNSRGDLVGRTMGLISQGWLDRHSVTELAVELGVTARHLRRVMIDALGAPPLALARAQRAQNARILIETTTLTFTDIAFASGFSSLRQFNDTIRRVFAATPTELRTTSSAEPAAAGRVSLRLPYRPPLAADHLIGWWRNRAIAGVTEPAGRQGLRTALRLARGNGLATLAPAQGQAWVDCQLELEDLADLTQAVAQCRAMFDLDADPVEVDAVLASHAALADRVVALAGLRSPGCADGFATAVFAVLGQQRSVAAARTIAGRIVDRTRSHEATGSGQGGPAIQAQSAKSAPDAGVAAGDSQPDAAHPLSPFPSPVAIAQADLDGIGLNRRAIDTIRTIAERFDGRDHELSPAGDRRAVADELLAVKGIGPWTANYVAMRVFADPDIYLAGDLIADRSATALGLDAAAIASLRPWRSYLTHHLWAAGAALAKG